MNELQVFNQDVIPVYTTDAGDKVVMGRELHERLCIGKDYSTWFNDMCKYGFSEGGEFSPISGKTSEQGGRPRTDHIMSLDMAKHIAMIQRTPQGFAIRQKLIELEKSVSRPPATQLELLAAQAQAMVELERKTNRLAEQAALAGAQAAATSERLDKLVEMVSQDRWAVVMKERIEVLCCGNSMVRMKLLGWFYRQVEDENNVNLDSRLLRKRSRAKKAGVKYADYMAMTKLDAIAEDPKLCKCFAHIVDEWEKRA